jgi:twitching motility protein PilT
MLKQLLDKVVKPGVSDLHLKANEPPLIRHLGQLIPVGTNALRTEDVESLVNGMLDAKQLERLNSRGDLDFSYAIEGIGRLRVNVYRQRGSYAIAIRIIPLEARTFEELHLPADTFEKLCQTSRGLILISGVTGAGKTTTLNAMIDYMNTNFSYNIITLEDPIEYSHVRKKSSISQREIGRDVTTYAEALEFMFRQDPDVIVLGEIRTVDTYKAAIEGAASGHLVMATVHSSDALDALDRIVNAFDFQQQPYVRVQLMNALKAVVSQRLIPERQGKGCLPATEILFGTLQLKKLLLTNSTTEAKFLMEKGSAYGMHTFDQDLQRMVEEQAISPGEALNYASNPNDLRIKLQNLGGAGLEVSK